MINFFKKIFGKPNKNINQKINEDCTFSPGDKVLFIGKHVHNSLLRQYGYDYFLVEKVHPHKQRKSRIACRVVYPDGVFCVDASPDALIYYKP